MPRRLQAVTIAVTTITATAIAAACLASVSTPDPILFQDFAVALFRYLAETIEQVVLVRFENPPMRMLGFVTREDLTTTSSDLDQDQIAVYLPMSYQLGGFTIIVSRSMLSPVAMSVEEAMRWAMTAGVSGEPQSSDAGA